MASQLTGTKELAAKLKQLKVGVKGRALRDSVQKAMLPLISEAVDAVPVGTREHRVYTGRLVQPGFAQESIRLKMWTSRDKEVATGLLGVAPEAYYVLSFLELGTSKIPAQPWLTPLFERRRGSMVLAVGAELRAKIERIAKRQARSSVK